jgi:hypothetical protein
MKKTFPVKLILIWLEFLVFIWLGLWSPGLLANSASNSPPGNHILNSFKTQVKPQIDGKLDDETWQVEPLQRDFISYSPIYGEILPYKTLVWTAYDSQNLYFAFKCFDPESQKIKTSITRRDSMYRDDWVGLSLDAMGNKQSSYHLFINPNGIQGDALYTSVLGEGRAPDYVWESAGKIVSNGYQVEICIPLRSIGFKSGKEVKMGILFWRYISRLGMSGSWPGIKPGQGIFNTHSAIIYRGIKKPLKLELLPGITYSSNRERMSPQQWRERDAFTALGIGLTYGITSSITADITVNPDFSQVESDAFQVEMNQRYPLFYSEKRPFFMEGVDVFSFFTHATGFLPHAVHTRRIVNPLWSAKITGTQGKTAFGIISALDEAPDQKSFFGIARGKHSLGKDNYIGFLYSGHESSAEYNRVIGTDIGYRFKHQKINASLLYSMSGDKDPTPGIKNRTNSSSFNFLYFYDTKTLAIETAFEHIGRDFRMDSSFLRRTGINNSWIWSGYSFYTDSKKLPWLKLIQPEVFFQYLHDLRTKMDDSFLFLGVNFNFTRRGYFWINYSTAKEGWQGQTFDLDQLELGGGIQLYKWLGIEGRLNRGERIYYDAVPSFKGKGYEGSLSLVFQPNKNLNQQFSFFHSDLSRDEEKIYDVNILYSRTTYQFNKYFFLRGVFQYNSFEKRLLTDFLASFTLIPGTVLHVGYGGLYENREWRDNNWLYRQGDMLNIKRSIFLKASYLWRF